MKALVIYQSVHHGNTKKVADVLAEVLEADLVKSNEAKDISLEQYDIIGFGSGIFHGKHHKNLYKLIEELNITGKDTFVFSTSGIGKKSYNKALIEKLTEKGALIRGSFSCKGFDTFSIFKLVGGISKGHPDNTDLENAKSFAKSLLK